MPTNMTAVLIQVVGAPQNSLEELILYLGAVVMSVLMVFMILIIIKYIADHLGS